MKHGKRLIFIHIHKCGGSTLQRIVRKNFGASLPRRISRRITHFGRKPGSLLPALKQSAAENDYLMGHFCFGIHNHLPGESIYITMLREPKERLMSLYRFSKSNPDAYYHRSTKDQSFSQFMTSGQVLEADNGMVRFLSGDSNPEEVFINRKPFGAIGSDDLESAMKNVEKYFTCVGFIEYFDASILLFEHYLNLNKIHYLTLNESVPDTEKPIWKHEFDSYIRYDQELYDHLLEKFEEEMKALPSLQKGSLEKYTESNSLHQKRWGTLYKKYSGAKARIRQLESNLIK
jgi:hypothetical protein